LGDLFFDFELLIAFSYPSTHCSSAVCCGAQINGLHSLLSVFGAVMPKPSLSEKIVKHRATNPQRFTPLELETRPTVETAAYAYYMHIAQQTARIHACKSTGPVRPIRIPGTAKLHWPVAAIRRVLAGMPA
jgi:hypothetical protein